MRWLFALWATLTLGFWGLHTADQRWPPPLMPPSSVEVLDQDGLALRTFPVDDGRWRVAARLDDIDPGFIEALLHIEDKRFFHHRGVDGWALVRALRDNVRQRRIVSGASTITMQTARLLEPRSRTLWSKGIEAIRAHQLERRLTKNQILELYLTLAPYGGNLEGLRTATWSYFGTDTDELSDSAIALMLALPQSPEARRPDRRPHQAKAARDVILNRLAAEGFLTQAQADAARVDPVPRARRRFPDKAWHFAEQVVSTGTSRIRTTVDRGVQLALERSIHQAVHGYDETLQAAGLVVRIEDRAIIGSVGSAGRERPGGWLDLTRRRRSPGSVLKPFIYGLAMQEGLVAPSTRVADIPSRFGTYTPENFARTFNGELTVATALQHSLNVPAVLVLDAVGTDRFIGILKMIGISVTVPQGREGGAGLAIALGGLGLTMQDIATLYAGLGDGGTIKPLAYTPADAQANRLNPGVRMLALDAAERLLTILRDAPSPQGRMPADLSSAAPRIAFKTGTSYGFRDAWAVGVSDQHVAVVWLGRADGAPRPGWTGRKAALPTLFSLFDTIEPQRSSSSLFADQGRQGPSKVVQNDGPTIAFPPDGAVLWRKPNGEAFVLAGRAAKGRWFANGQPIHDDQHGNILWSPEAAGFHRITLSDQHGQQTEATVRVRFGPVLP